MILIHRMVSHRTLALALAGVTLCSVESAFPQGSVSSIAEREIARRFARMEDARQAMERGDKLYIEEDYEASLSEYKSALDALPNAPMTQDWRDLASAKYADCSVALARNRASNGRYAEAGELLAGALAINPNHEGAKKFRIHMEDSDRFPPALTPEHVKNVADVKRLLTVANSYKELGDYANAIKTYQDVLRIDSTNIAARRGMETVEQKRSQYLDSARDQTRATMLRELDEMWEQKVPAIGLDQQTVVETTVGPGADILLKMQRIRFPKVSFAGATIDEAIEFLRVKSKDLDVSEPSPDKKGVNIILKAGDVPLNAQITLDLTDVPMAEALKYVTELAQMKFKVDQFAVLVVPLSEVSDTQYTRIYRVPPDFESIGGGDGGGAGAGAAAAPADPFAAGGGAAPASALIQRKNAKQILSEQGITFPEGASAVFNKVTSQLIVKNTAPQLDLVEMFVESINIAKPKQIYITTKFVEVTQKNTDELGFDWLLGPFNIPSSDGVFASGGTSGALNSANYAFSTPGAGTPAIGQNPVSGGLRFGTQAIVPDSIDGLLSGASATSAVSPGIMTFAGVFTDPQFQVVIRALNQKKGVDLMSAPSVTTKSGQKATVEVVREFLYPTEFDPPEIPQNFGSTGGTTTNLLTGASSQGGAFPVTPTTPTTFEMRPVGVRMEVEPTVGNDNNTIDLNLAPEVTEFEGFINYGSPIQTTSQDALGNPTTLVLTENKIEQPVFSSRKVQTSVTIWDSQTVALGGLIREDVQDVEDKVPLLGDIPWIGRLFQTKAEDHFKRNLMIFVTARLIDPSGQPVRQTTSTVTPVGGPDMGGPTPLLPPAQ